jgi:gliding motility-associated protein GldC
MKKSQIKFNVTLDDKKNANHIEWEAEDSGVEGVKPCKSVIISLWDSTDNGTMRIDLWTKEMMVEDMKRFFYETFMSMADTYDRATSDKENSVQIREFATHFGKATKVLK